jgi:putative drug exporter of the RND superfamily
VPVGFSAAIRRWRVAILLIWVVIGLGGLVASSNLNGRLTTSLAVPASESARAAQILRVHFADSVEGDFSVVAPVSATTATSTEDRLGAAVATVAGLAISQEKVDGHLLIAGITSALDLRDAAALTQPLRRAIALEHLRGALVTGPAALQHDLSPVLAQDLRRGEIIGGALALLVSLSVLGVSAEALIPLLVAGAAMGAALILLDAMSHVVTLVLYTPNVVVLVGLGLAVDYTLLWLRRVRDERRAGARDPVNAAAPTRRTLVVAAVVATTGLATMLAVPIPFLRSLGVAGLVVPVCALAATMTLAPALSSFAPATHVGAHRRAGAFWPRWSRGVVTRPGLVLAGSLVVLALLSAPLAGLSLSAGSLTAVPAGLPSTQALSLIESHVGVGVVAPVQIVLNARGASVSDPAIRAARNALAARVLGLRDVAVVAEGEKPPYVDATGRYERIIVVTQQDFASPATSTLVDEIRAAVTASHFPSNVHVSVGGAPAQARDFVTRVDTSLPLVIAGALVLAGIILALSFSSLPIALLAILLDLASVAGALGVLTAVFRYGFGASLLHTYRVDAIEAWVPVFLFAVLFGLSMDYEVFVVGAVREARLGGLDSRAAIERALSATGPVVTGAAGVMVAALVGLIIGRVAGLQELGVGLAAGVAIDALLVRALVLPSVLALLGERAW